MARVATTMMMVAIITLAPGIANRFAREEKKSRAGGYNIIMGIYPMMAKEPERIMILERFLRLN